MRRVLETAAARVVLASLRYAPLPLAHVLARLFARALDLAIPRLRRTAYRNLSFALPDADAGAITDGVFRSIARILVSVARFPEIERIEYDGLEHFLEAKRRGRGVLFATAHMGNWELSAFAHALMTEPMNVVVRPLDNRTVDVLVEEKRALSGNRVIGKKEGARGILRALARNEAVGVLIDQNASPAEGTFVDFFGVPACSGTGFARIANHTGAAVIPGYALWLEKERRYVLRFLPILEMTGDEERDTARLHATLESVIRQYPDQWLWVHRRWKTRPAGEPSLY